MSGRFTLRRSEQAVAEHFQTHDVLSSDPLHNIRPEQFVPVIRLDRQDRGRLHLLLWGLIPHWEKSPTEIYVNARSETVDQKRPFREAPLSATSRSLLFRPGALRRPYVQLPDDRLFAIAGLWERWLGEDGKGLDSWVMLTTAANSATRHYDHRMPAIVQPQDHDTWLRPRDHDAAMLKQLLFPYPPDEMVVSAQ